MPTEHRQYSTSYQIDAIAAYASAHGIAIVATYEDSGTSGLTLNGQPELRRLIADVVGGTASFDTILVYEIARWGHLQDAYASAHLEYLCRASGVRVEYCAERAERAEPFSHDGTPFASIFKLVKRALPAEYSTRDAKALGAAEARFTAQYVGFVVLLTILPVIPVSIVAALVLAPAGLMDYFKVGRSSAVRHDCRRDARTCGAARVASSRATMQPGQSPIGSAPAPALCSPARCWRPPLQPNGPIRDTCRLRPLGVQPDNCASAVLLWN